MNFHVEFVPATLNEKNKATSWSCFQRGQRVGMVQWSDTSNTYQFNLTAGQGLLGPGSVQEIQSFIAEENPARRRAEKSDAA